MNRLCLDCGSKFGASLFIWLDDSLWEQIGLTKSDYLCSHCIINRVEKVKSYGYLMFTAKNSINSEKINLVDDDFNPVFITEQKPLGQQFENIMEKF